jgi:predicted TIM-barrel fold metal-dependent hydrolase
VHQGQRIFDTHTHIGRGLHSGRVQTAAQLIREMDRFGVDHSLVIPFPVVEDHREAHDEIARAIREHPGRLSGAACVNPFVPRQYFDDEIRRCVEELGFVAMKLQPQYQGINPLWPVSSFVYETALLHNLPLIIHTGSGIPHALPSLQIPVAQRYPDLRIILAHCGGGGMFKGEAIVAASLCPNIYLELSSLMPHDILEVLHHIPSTRLLAGSDLLESTRVELSKFFLTEGVTEPQCADILWNTASRLFFPQK